MAEVVSLSPARRPLRWMFQATVLTVGLSLFTGCQLLGDLTSSPTSGSKPIAVTGVVLNKGTTALLVGASEQLTASVVPVNAANQSVGWISSDKTVATVTPQGLVTGTGKGTAVITVVTNEGSWSQQCTVTVSDAVVSVTGVVVKQTTNLLVGGVEALLPTVVPAGATNQNVTWSTSLKSVADVDSHGVVTGVAAGKAFITVTTEDGAFTDTCEVTVSPVVVAVTGVTLDKTSTALFVGGSETLTATVSPVNATTQNLHWTSLPQGIVSVDANGVVTGLSAGEATVTATSVDGSLTAECLVTVSPVPVMVTGVTLNPGTSPLLVGASEALYASVTPSDADEQGLIWKSSAQGIASVDANGVVTGVSAGSATITVTTVDGAFSDDFTVTVVKPSTVTVGFTWGSFQSVKFTPNSYSVNGPTTLTLSLDGANTGTQWQWFVDGEPVVGANTDTYAYAASNGFHTVSVTVVHGGVLYSGSITVTAINTNPSD